MGFARFILRLYRWQALSDRSLLEMKAKVDRGIPTAMELVATSGFRSRGAEKDLEQLIKSQKEISKELRRRGLLEESPTSSETLGPTEGSSRLGRSRRDLISAYAMRVMSTAAQCADAFGEAVQTAPAKGEQATTLSDHDRLMVLFEFQFLCFHMTDRMSFGSLSEEERDLLMTQLTEECTTSTVEAACVDWPEDLKHKIAKECTENYTSFTAKFSQCRKIAVGGDENPKDSLLWEFASELADQTGMHDILSIVAIQGIAVDALTTLDIKVFVDEFRR